MFEETDYPLPRVLYDVPWAQYEPDRLCLSALDTLSRVDCRVPSAVSGGGDCALPSIFLRLFEWGPTNCARWSVPALLALTVSFTVPYS